MRFFTSRFHLGLRTVKTAVAAVIALVLVGFYGMNEANVFFCGDGCHGGHGAYLPGIF